MALCFLKLLVCAYLIVSVVRVLMLWGKFRCEKPVQVWLLGHQLLSLCLCLGYQLARHCAGPDEAPPGLLLPLTGSRMQKVVSFLLLLVIVPAFLASCFLGLFWFLSSTFEDCWPSDFVNQPQVICLVLVAGCLLGMSLLLFSLGTLCPRSRAIRARTLAQQRLAAAGRAAVRPAGCPGVGLLVPELLRHCPEAECDKDCDVHCSVCQENCREGQQIRTVVVCGHQYHGECLELWLRNRPTCPNCNQDVTTPVI